MRGGVVAAGIILMIIGVVFVLSSNTQVGYTGGTSGGLGGYQTQNSVLLVLGLALGGIGFITFIAGLAASKHEKSIPSYVPPKYTHYPAPIPQPTSPVTAHEVLVICPKCAERVSSKSKFCPECGADLKPKPKVEPREIEEEKTEAPKPKGKPKRTGFCIYCGTELPEGSDFCPECGKKAKKIK